MFVTAIALFVLALNIGATFGICKDEHLNSFQRKVMIAFVWTIPIMGAMLFHSFRRDTRSAEVGDDGLSGYEVVDPEMPVSHDNSDNEHGYDWLFCFPPNTLEEIMNTKSTPDHIAERIVAEGRKLTVKNLEDGQVLIEGDSETLRLLASMIEAQADFAEDCGFQISPRGSGSKIFTKQSTVGFYIHRVPCEHGAQLNKDGNWMQLVFVAGVVLLVVVLNSTATFGILRDDGLFSFQKKAQIAVIWSLPIIGAALTYFIRRLHSLPPTHQGTDTNLLTDDAMNVWISDGGNHSSADNGHD
jgi:hypothetical protein